MPTEQSDSRAYAGFFVRMFAFLVDVSLFWIVSGFVRLPFWIYTMSGGSPALTEPLIFSFSAWDIIIYLASASYFIVLTYCSGMTVGKRLMGLRVVSADGDRLSFWNVLYRETVGRYLSSILMIGYIMIGISSEKKGLHDLLCDTRVIYWMRPEPQYTKPIAPQHAAPQPYTPQPYTPQPYTSQPYTSQPYTSQPYTSQPYTSQPYTSQPNTPPHIPDFPVQPLSTESPPEPSANPFSTPIGTPYNPFEPMSPASDENQQAKPLDPPEL